MLVHINRFFFGYHYSVFDLLCFTLLYQVAQAYSYWWYLMIIPISIASTITNKVFAGDE